MYLKSVSLGYRLLDKNYIFLSAALHEMGVLSAGP